MHLFRCTDEPLSFFYTNRHTTMRHSDNGLTGTVNDRVLRKVVDLLEDSPHTWHGLDVDVYTSIADYKWVAKDNGGNSYTVILNVSNSEGGPGFRIRVITLDDMKEYFFSDDFDPSFFGIDDLQTFWDHADVIFQLSAYIKSNSSIYYADGFYDKAMSASELMDILADVYDINIGRKYK